MKAEDSDPTRDEQGLEQSPPVRVYTDGACDPNPGPGGWAAILVYSSREKVLTGGHPATTNNRMELQAASAALEALKRPCRVEIYTDSEYLRRGITEWLPRWIANGWRTAGRKPVRNKDLWRRLKTLAEVHHVTWRWIRGHAGHPFNERADRLAWQAIDRSGVAEPEAEAQPKMF
jgi:ribonuclease HI